MTLQYQTSSFSFFLAAAFRVNTRIICRVVKMLQCGAERQSKSSIITVKLQGKVVKIHDFAGIKSGWNGWRRVSVVPLTGTHTSLLYIGRLFGYLYFT